MRGYSKNTEPARFNNSVFLTSPGVARVGVKKACFMFK